MTQEELRYLYCERIKRERQRYIAGVTMIDESLLSKFKLGKVELLPHLFKRLETYLTGNETGHFEE